MAVALASRRCSDAVDSMKVDFLKSRWMMRSTGMVLVILPDRLSCLNFDTKARIRRSAGLVGSHLEVPAATVVDHKDSAADQQSCAAGHSRAGLWLGFAAAAAVVVAVVVAVAVVAVAVAVASVLAVAG